ncbi:MAG: prepilin-type N-terminal cleavage/methylation domain-containing protein [Candidatus Omnitrophica bacterium]|nr:prepilin-type N-terminal cleavage/methylation domain-containing protein [Candidatus Omnitrophota bacterium]
MNTMAKQSGFTLTEIMIVVGIFALIIGGSFALLSSGQLSVSISEAQIRAEEEARRAMDKISRELRLSETGKVLIYDALGGTALAAPNTGQVLFFQVPVLDVDGTLKLNTENELTWGTEDTENKYIVYYLDANSQQLLRNTCTQGEISTGIFTDQAATVALDISNIAFQANSDNLFTTELTSRGQIGQYISSRTLRSSINLRN